VLLISANVPQKVLNTAANTSGLSGLTLRHHLLHAYASTLFAQVPGQRWLLPYLLSQHL